LRLDEKMQSIPWIERPTGGGCCFTLALLMHNIYLEILATGINARRNCNQMLVHSINPKDSTIVDIRPVYSMGWFSSKVLNNNSFCHLFSAGKPVTFYIWALY
jgi:hypothetical protein